MFGNLVMVGKNKQGDRLLDEAIDIGINGYMRHYPNAIIDGLVAYLSPRLFNECDVSKGSYRIPVDENVLTPYPGVWIGRKESVDV
jgi:hypothetical protein